MVVFEAKADFASTVRRRSAFSPSALAPGKRLFASAATPDTCGVAIDVPSNQSYSPPGSVEYTFVPGAARSTLLAPTFENEARWSVCVLAATATTFGRS